ncbi:uncharacterized protein VNE69_04205 [Vairimorpha necatrix]|uniref:Uncharacterized protein n=1 Tax=Vairimorpha necatrix TaxID=6039 RepID=A0AAX4JBU2_9MICR
MNFSECFTQEDEKLNKKILTSVKLLVNRISNFPKNQNIDCLLCSEKLNLHNIHDLTRIYSCAYFCMKFHCKSLLKIDIEDLFIFEIFLLNFIKTEDISDIEYLIKYSNNTNEKMYKLAFKDQLIAIYKTHSNEKGFNIKCEQEIDSLTYLYYKKFKRNVSECVFDNYLLVVLFLRKEYQRFSQIFNLTKKNSFNIKMAILFDIIEENKEELIDKCKLLESIESDCLVHMDILKTFLISLNGKHNFDFNEIINLFDTHGDINSWVSELIDRIYWQNCVKLWCKNRNDNSSSVDNSMIDICIKNNKYEDGWLIFNNIVCIETSRFLRGLNLCCTALKFSRNCEWKKRLVSILNMIFENRNILNLENLVENLLTNIQTFSVFHIIRILNELQTHLIKISLNDSFFECILGFYNVYCYEHQNVELNRVCCTNAIYFYNKWNKGRHGKCNLFRRKKSEWDTKIYSHMLSICDIARNCEFFTKVCKDLVNNDTHITRDLCRQIENFHSKNCENCEYRRKQIVTTKESSGLFCYFFK